MDQRKKLDQYNVVWNSPSRDASGSMPIGNGDLAANVWVEESGDLLLLLAKSDAWDENSINLKLGRIRVKLLPMEGQSFRQTLDIARAQIIIESAGTTIRIWLDANHPILRIDVESAQELALAADVEIWRNEPYAIKTQTSDLFRNLQGKDPHPTIVCPDRVLPEFGDPKDTTRVAAGLAPRVLWCHHNEKPTPDPYDVNMRLQGLGDMLDRMPHPLESRIFGAAIEGANLLRKSERTLASDHPRRHWHLQITALTLHPSTVENWQKQIEQLCDENRAADLTSTFAEHERRWKNFWQRSWIYVTSPNPDEAENVFQITQSYILQRFMNAAAGRGSHPIKHNGSLFSVGRPAGELPEDPDFRRWGSPGFWFQNQRLIYWPMLAAGDFDLLAPFFAMYRSQLPLQRQRTHAYFHHGGAHYPETVTFWGAEISAHYEWTPFEQRQSPEATCPYVRYYWAGGLELTLMMLEYFARTLDENFARDTFLPIADAITEFFDLHYPRDGAGKIHFAPAQSLETWHEAINPLPEIAGLTYLLPKLLDLPQHLTTDAMRSRWTRMVSELPPLPRGASPSPATPGQGREGVVLLPAEHFAIKKNSENPELYCIFPFRLFGVNKPELQLARDTFAARLHKSHDCWSQDEIQMAHLGLADEAKEFLSRRAAPAAHSQSRFPAFWDAFHDWIPDVDHGGVLQLALQSMLLQSEGEKILLLPAWPKEWDADFKLHAARQKVVEGKVRAGRIVELQITPG